MTCANSAEGMIHYSGKINQKFQGSYSQTFRLDQPDDFIAFGHNGGNAGFGIYALSESGFAGFFPCAYNSDVASVSNLDRLQPISTRPFAPGGTFGIMASTYRFDCGGGNRGEFQEPGVAFIGFKFNGGRGVQYGWARVETRGAADNSQYRLIDYAYGDVGDRIRAGQKAGGHATELESLGGLALGAAGLLAWRRRHSKMIATS